MYLHLVHHNLANFCETRYMYIHLCRRRRLKHMNSTPAYLYPLVLTGAVASVVALLFILNGALKLARFSSHDRIRGVWTGSALLTAWFLAALVPSWLGFYGGSSNRIPTIQYGLLIPILAGIAMFRLWPSLRRIVEIVPQRWIVSVQV